MVAALGLRGHCHLLGPRRDVPRLQAGLDLATSSSVSEAFPLAVGEAMACGVPCVATDVGDSASIVGETGRVVPPRNPRALAAAWEELLALAPDARRRLGQAARLRVQERYGLAAITRRYEDLYETLCAGGGGGGGRGDPFSFHPGGDLWATVFLWFPASPPAARPTGPAPRRPSSRGRTRARGRSARERWGDQGADDPEACGGGGATRPGPVRGALRAGLRRPLDLFTGPRVDSFPPEGRFKPIGPIRSFQPAGSPMHRGNHSSDLSAVRFIRRYMREFGPFDVIHGHSSKGGALSRLAAIGSDVRVFYTPNALVTMDPRLSPLKRLFYQAVEWAISKATDRIIAVSPEEQRHGIRFGLSRSRVILIPSGFEPVLFPPMGVVRRELCLPEDCRVVGFIGRLVEQKAPDVLIEAFATTANMLPQCRLVVVGSGPLERSLRVMADLLGIANKVLWLGERDGKCLLPAFDLLALPSRYEGLPLVTLEALSAGLPVVATATAGVELPIRHRRNGLIVPPDRPDLFATALVELLSDPLKLEQFGRRSREISTEFTVRRMVDSTHDAYLDCIGMRVMEARPRLCEGVG